MILLFTVGVESVFSEKKKKKRTWRARAAKMKPSLVADAPFELVRLRLKDSIPSHRAMLLDIEEVLWGLVDMVQRVSRKPSAKRVKWEESTGSDENDRNDVPDYEQVEVSGEHDLLRQLLPVSFGSNKKGKKKSPIPVIRREESKLVLIKKHENTDRVIPQLHKPTYDENRLVHHNIYMAEYQGDGNYYPVKILGNGKSYSLTNETCLVRFLGYNESVEVNRSCLKVVPTELIGEANRLLDNELDQLDINNPGNSHSFL